MRGSGSPSVVSRRRFFFPANTSSASRSAPGAITTSVKMLAIASAGTYDTGLPDLTQVHPVPDPYLATSAYDLAPTTKQMMFVNLPSRATLRIYSLTGILVRVLEHDDTTGGGRLSWDVRNRNNQFLASGVYFFHVITPEGYEHVGKFTIVNSAGQN